MTNPFRLLMMMTMISNRIKLNPCYRCCLTITTKTNTSFKEGEGLFKIELKGGFESRRFVNLRRRDSIEKKKKLFF